MNGLMSIGNWSDFTPFYWGCGPPLLSTLTWQLPQWKSQTESLKRSIGVYGWYGRFTYHVGWFLFGVSIGGRWAASFAKTFCRLPSPSPPGVPYIDKKPKLRTACLNFFSEKPSNHVWPTTSTSTSTGWYLDSEETYLPPKVFGASDNQRNFGFLRFKKGGTRSAWVVQMGRVVDLGKPFELATALVISPVNLKLWFVIWKVKLRKPATLPPAIMEVENGSLQRCFSFI